jgi:hypothetical protein
VVTVGEIELRIVISPGDGQDRQAASSAKSLLYSLVADPRSLTLVVADQRSGGQPPRQGTPSSRFCQILATMVVTTGINDDTLLQRSPDQRYPIRQCIPRRRYHQANHPVQHFVLYRDWYYQDVIRRHLCHY